MQNTMGGAKIKMKIFVETEKGKMNRGENCIKNWLKGLKIASFWVIH